jgi:hypothetical protein
MIIADLKTIQTCPYCKAKQQKITMAEPQCLKPTAQISETHAPKPIAQNPKAHSPKPKA